MKKIVVNNGPGESSAMLQCRNKRLMKKYNFSDAFWVALDEGRTEKAIRLVGRKRGSQSKSRPHGKWKVKVLRSKVPKALRVKTDDSEAISRVNDEIVVVGSHFGSKKGPLDKQRAFVARFNEKTIDKKLSKKKVRLELARHPFKLHRAINDALCESGIDMLPLGTHVRRSFIEESLEKGFKASAEWASDIRVEDTPINIEGVSFLSEDRALVGLRFPTTATGAPIVLEVSGMASFFQKEPQQPHLRARIYGVLEKLGSRAHPAGIRGMEVRGGRLHILTGPIGSIDKINDVTLDYPGSHQTTCRHVSIKLRPNTRDGRKHGFPNADHSFPSYASLHRKYRVEKVFRHKQVEGMAPMGDAWIYCQDIEGELVLLISSR